MTNKIAFAKFHGTGNDFIIIDHTEKQYIDSSDHDLIARMCHRRFGIGADGLMILEKGQDGLDFNMLYYNSDGKESSMCGNGGRCISYAAALLGLRPKDFRFSFQGDIYESSWDKDLSLVRLRMQDLATIELQNGDYILDTGSPHFVRFLEKPVDFDVKREGAAIRYSETFKEEGINVNFCFWNGTELEVSTYERGVEDQTYSCGTGVVASAIALSELLNYADGIHRVSLKTLGGDLAVEFQKSQDRYIEIYLIGPAVKVYEGVWEE